MIKDKGKGIMIEPEVPLKRKDQDALDEDLARNLQAQLEAELIEEESIARKKEEEANIALIESWDNTQAMMEANFELAQKLQTKEQAEITIEERSRLERAMMNSKLFDKSEEVKYLCGYEFRGLESNEKEVEDDTAELKKHLVIKKDDDIAIDAIPLAIKPPMIVEYKLLKEGIMMHFQLIRADGNFGKRFVPQQELSVEQAFWLQTSHPNTDQAATSPVKIEAPRELPKVSLVNTSLKNPKYNLGNFDTVVKKRSTPDAITEGEWSFEHTKKCSIDKKLFEIEKKELKLENERLLEHIICQDVVNIVMHAGDKSVNVLPVQITFLDDNIALDMMMENDRLMELLVSQDLVHTVVNSLAVINDYQMIALAVLKLDLEPLFPKLKNNKEAHVDYIRITKENADTLCDIVEQARTSNPLDNALAYACMYTKQIQELLVYVSDTCPSSPSRSEKLVAVTPINKARKVTFAKTSTTSENNTKKRVDLHKTQTTNKPLVSSASVKSSTNASRSIPRRNSMSKFVCSTCKKCLFDANHDLCVVNYLFDVNARARAKFVKSIKKKEWKPTGKMFQNVGYKWVPIGRTFTLVGNKYPLTRFTSTKIVPPRKVVKSIVIKNIKLSSPSQWRPRETKHVCLSSEPRIVEGHTNRTLVLPSKKDYEILFQPLFYEYFNPPPHAVSPESEFVATPKAVDPVGSPSSTTIDEDVPSASTSPTTQEI
ncbi:hypothetical protein Tco_1502756 [Tanacetum coccineum]